ncbi:MAG: class I adenylate-forming enzyme family protein, partial [Planctomycetota bacterium]
MNVVSVLDQWAAATPQQPAIIASRGRRDVRITYGELRDASSRLAGELKRRGVQPGDRVAILVGLSIDAYIALIGVLWAGAVPVIVDPGGGLDRARACFRKA